MKELDHDFCYRAICASDSRFDGVFFVGVTSTGIYCRTVCRARKPKRENCRFYANSTLAEQAGFRPCKRCFPEQSPGLSTFDFGSAVVASAVQRIEQGQLSDGAGLEPLAEQIGVSTRHLRREFQNRLGVSPVKLAQTQRLLLAKRLLAETDLPITQIALVSGFGSLRRCNSLFKSTYGFPPTFFRRDRLPSSDEPTESGCFSLKLGYRPPFAWQELLQYLRSREIPGVELIDDKSYARTLMIEDRSGWIRVSNLPEHNALRVEISLDLLRVLPMVLARVRATFDLDATPSRIADALADEDCFAESFRRSPGLRLPGAMDRFETAVRTIIGQQVSVPAATTVMRRLVQSFGSPFVTPLPELYLGTVTPARLASESVDTLAPLGMNAARAKTILGLSRAIVENRVQLEHSVAPEQTIVQLQELDGIGPWTANYFGMRVLGWPDAFVSSDLVVKRQLAPLTEKQIEARSQAWRPWRAYAVMHLWNSAGFTRFNSPIKNENRSN